MSEAKKFFICTICGNQVELMEDGGGEVICCGEPMECLEESSEAAKNKEHAIHVEKVPGGIRVQIGKEQKHPMNPNHFIQWLECWVGNCVHRKHFKPTEEPTAVFMIEEWMEKGEKPILRAHCSVHGMRFCDCLKGEGENSCSTAECSEEKEMGEPVHYIDGMAAGRTSDTASGMGSSCGKNAASCEKGTGTGHSKS